MLQVKGPKRNVTETGPQAISISSGSKHKAEAAQFVAFLTNTENQRASPRPTGSSRPPIGARSPGVPHDGDQWDVAYQWLAFAEDVKPHMFGFFGWEWQTFIPQMELVILGKSDLTARWKRRRRKGTTSCAGWDCSRHSTERHEEGGGGRPRVTDSEDG